MYRYKDLVTTECENGWRWYGIQENPFIYPSASVITKEGAPVPQGRIDWWMNNSRNHCDKILKEAGDYGTSCHMLFEAVLKEEDALVSENYIPPVNKFKEWVFKHKVKLIGSEFTVVSKKYGFAGRADALLEVDGKVELVDWKTGNIYSDTWGAKTAGYHLAITEMLGMKKEDLGLRVVHIPRNGGPIKEFKYQHIDFMQDTFLHYIELFKWAPNFNYLKKKGWKYVMQPIFERRSV